MAKNRNSLNTTSPAAQCIIDWLLMVGTKLIKIIVAPPGSKTKLTKIVLHGARVVLSGASIVHFFFPRLLIDKI